MEQFFSKSFSSEDCFCGFRTESWKNYVLILIFVPNCKFILIFASIYGLILIFGFVPVCWNLERNRHQNFFQQNLERNRNHKFETKRWRNNVEFFLKILNGNVAGKNLNSLRLTLSVTLFTDTFANWQMVSKSFHLCTMQLNLFCHVILPNKKKMWCKELNYWRVFWTFWCARTIEELPHLRQSDCEKAVTLLKIEK